MSPGHQSAAAGFEGCIDLVGIPPGETLLLVDDRIRRVSPFMPDGDFLGPLRVEGRGYLSPRHGVVGVQVDDPGVPKVQSFRPHRGSEAASV